jgi:hypothetical protein
VEALAQSAQRSGVTVTPTEWVAIGTMASTAIGAIGLIIKDRRSGKLSTHEHQMRYIEDQQADIAALRRDLSALWAWAVKAIRKATDAGIELDPLPSAPPSTTAEK